MGEDVGDARSEVTPDAVPNVNDGNPKPPEMTFGDWFVKPGPLSARHRKLAALAAAGKTNSEIARELGYTDSRVSVLLTNSDIKMEVDRLLDATFAADHGLRLKALGHDALNLIENALRDPQSKVKEEKKLELAQWLLEKLTGKAVQQVEVSGNVLISLLDKLDSMKVVGPSPSSGEERAQLSAAPEEPVVRSPRSDIQDWIDAWNAPSPESEVIVAAPLPEPPGK